MSKLRISGIADDSIVDGTGIRFTIFTQGCLHNCKGCHNPQTHSPDGGYVVDTDDLFAQISENILLDGVTFSGGEPMLQAEPLVELAKRIKRELHLNLIIYTGYTYEELLAMQDENVNALLDLADVLIDGRYIDSKRDLSLLYRGSSNQRIIKLKNCTIAMDGVAGTVDVSEL